METHPRHQHACNRVTDTDGNSDVVVFKYDFTNVNALEKTEAHLRKANETTRTYIEQLEDIKTALATEVAEKLNAQAQLSVARKEYNKLSVESTDAARLYKEQLDTCSASSANANSEKVKAQAELRTLHNVYEKLRQEHEILTSQVARMEKQLPGPQRVDNSLPIEFHNSIVMIISAAELLAIDARKGNRMKLGRFLRLT